MAVSFDFKQRLGAGHFGEVWRAIDTGLQAERAVKIIPPDKVPDPNNFFREAQILKAAEHPNVVRVEETGTFSDGRVYVAMEYLPAGSVEDLARGAHLPLARARRVMVEVLRGLEHAHSRNILHRDIKPANILLGHHGEAKLSDFGLAVPRNFKPGSLGVKEYFYVLHMAPEAILKRTQSVQTDIYACGVTLYRLVNGDSYFVAPPSADLAATVSAGTFPDRSRYRAFVPLAMRRVINRALDVDPSDRFPDASSMRRALEALTIEMEWEEHDHPLGTIWLGSGPNSPWQKSFPPESLTDSKGVAGAKCSLKAFLPRAAKHSWEVNLQRTNGHWEVVVRKGAVPTHLRRVNDLCLGATNRRRAEKQVARLLQDLVLGKRR